MRRMGALACVIACLALPAIVVPPASAATPFRPVGPPGPLMQITFAPAPGSARVYGATRNDFWRSDDKGRTWTKVGYVPSSPFTCSYSVSPLDQDRVYTGCGGMSRDGGRTWDWVPVLDNTPQIDAAGTLYSLEYNTHGLVHRCTPDMASCANVLLPGADQFKVDPASSGLLVDGLQRSADGGATWSPFPLPATMVDANLSFDGRTPGKLLASGRDIDGHELFAASPNAGASWGPTRAVPLPAQNENASLVQAGGAGAQRRVWISTASGVVWTADDGVTFHAAQMGGLAIDPDDGSHAFASDFSLFFETHDTGVSWTLRNATQFGYDEFQSFTGSGSTLYVIVANVLWGTHDMGLTWAPVPALFGAKVSSVLASRDDPRIAYALGGLGGAGFFWQTTDGGATWVAHAPPPNFSSIDWIQGGHPDWVLAGQEESHDGGATWTYVDSLHPFGDADHRVTPSILIDSSTGARYATEPFGRIAADGSIAKVCPPQDTSCQGILYGDDAWIQGGHATVAMRTRDGKLWAMRDGGRWWRMALPPGNYGTQIIGDLTAPGPNAYFAVIGHSYVVSNGILIPLEAPSLPAPSLTATATVAHCATTLTADDADIAYSWRRDGVSLAGGTGPDRAIVVADRGRSLACTVTATNAWGSASAASAAYRVPGTASSRLKLRGSARIGERLRCSATVRVSWLRDGRALRNRHARTYRVGAADEGHALACQSKAGDGTLARSPALRVPKARGGAALLTR